MPQQPANTRGRLRCAARLQHARAPRRGSSWWGKDRTGGLGHKGKRGMAAKARGGPLGGARRPRLPSGRERKMGQRPVVWLRMSERQSHKGVLVRAHNSGVECCPVG